MNPITTNNILAIDLGKYKCVACILDPKGGEFRFSTFDTSRAELQKLIAKQSPGFVIIEACLLAGWVHDLCGELGMRCLVANTASEAWKFTFSSGGAPASYKPLFLDTRAPYRADVVLAGRGHGRVSGTRAWIDQPARAAT